ncbi:MAG: MFS transporter [Bordetella sp.]|nr:MFS transporter [Bordetella sp.]
MTALLALFMVINFMDKAILGIVAVPLMAELNIPPAQFGMIASSFFLFFSISAVAFGLLANHYSSKIILIVLAGIWGISQLPLACAASVPLLYDSRILLGIGEGPAYPLALHSCYTWFRDAHRNVPSSMIFQGVTVGLLISGPVLTYIMINHSWHAAFMLLGVASLVWMVLWWLLGGDGDVRSEASDTGAGSGMPRVSYWVLLTDRSFLANMLLYWTTYWIFSVMFTWIPAYMNKVMGYSTEQTGWMFMVFTGINIPLIFIGSWLSQHLLKRGVASVYARAWLSCAFVLAGGVCTLLSLHGVDNPTARVLLLALGCNLPQLTFVLSSATVAEITSDAQRSAAMSINSALATTGGLIAPALMGQFIGAGNSLAAGYEKGFMVSAGLAIAVSLIGLVFIRPEASRRRMLERDSRRDAALAPAAMPPRKPH